MASRVSRGRISAPTSAGKAFIAELLALKCILESKYKVVIILSIVVGDGRNKVQIIRMSATLPNLDTLEEWLEAALYCTNYRPVPLQEMVKAESTIFDTNFKLSADAASAK